MPKGNPKIADADFIKLFPEIGPSELARRCKTSESNIHKRRRRLEVKNHIRLVAPGPSATMVPREHSERIHLKVTDGIVLVGSDAHYWPGEATPAHRAFVKFAKDFKPQAIIMNGDAFDGASISRHPPIGWTRLPTVQEEIESCQDRLTEILAAKPMKCRTVWTLGNHDQRLETRIATVAPEFAKVAGTSLKDHFPLWEPAWATWINGDGPDGVVVKHRFKGGTHAPMNNALWSGRSIVTGHLHSAKVYPLTDYNGTRYGVDTGCMADPNGQQFVAYSEDNAKNWRSGFAILTFIAGKLLMPELVLVWDESHVQFRGNLIRI